MNRTKLLSRPNLLPRLALASSLFAIRSFAQEGEEVYLLDPFTAKAEEGYVATNSIAGTRTDTPIKDIPLNIHVFTKDLAEDLMLTSQVDLERYNASMVNGGADAHSSNVIQQSYNNFLFRGFRQNWSMRDGVRNYDPIDSQGFERVEVVKGPAAALYGLTYPGGVMNSVTKSALFGNSFTDVEFTIASHGEYRGTIDTNYYAKLGGESAFAIRFNGVYGETKDQRENSDGLIEFSQLNFAYALNEKTKFEVLYEKGFREKTVGLGTFTTGEVDGSGNALGNGAEVPIQATHSDISWDDNWASPGNKRNLDTQFIRARVTHAFSDDFVINAYFQDSDRVQVDSDGLNASGMGGSAAAWDMGFSSQGGNLTGWLNPNTSDEAIVMHYHHRDWQNSGQAFGVNAVYSLDTDAMKNTFTFGYNYWQEDFLTIKRTQPENSPNLWEIPVAANAVVPTPVGPPSDYFNDVAGAFGREDNSNEYFYASWQGSLFNDRLKTNIGVNRTEFELVQMDNGLSTSPDNITSDSQVSPMFGAVFDLNKSFSIFAVTSTSLFPTTDKNDFDVQMPAIEGKSIEGGFKFDTLDGKLSGTMSVYQIVQDGGAQQDPSADNRNKLRWDSLTPEQRLVEFPGIASRDELRDRNGNLGDLVPGAETTSEGYELDLVYRPVEAWQILLSYAHNETEVTDAVNTDLIGSRTAGAIEDQIAMITKYSFREGALEGSYVGLGAQYAGKAYQGDFAGVSRYNPSTTYLELFAGKRFELWGNDASVRINVKNVTEQETFVGWQATGSSSVVATNRYEVPVDRQFNLTFGYHF